MKRVIGILIGAAVVIAAGVWLTVRVRSNSADEKVQYKLATVETGMVKKTVSATGVLQPWTVVDIKSKAGGRVDAMLVDIGTRVTKGQVLAKIDPSDTQLSARTARADVDSAKARQMQSDRTYRLQTQLSDMAIQTAEAQLAVARAARTAAKARLATAQNAARTQPSLSQAAVAQAEAALASAKEQRTQLASTQAQEQVSAQAALDQATANLKNSRANLDRQRNLLARGFVSPQVVDNAEASHAVAAAQVATAQEKVRTIGALQQSERDAADARVRQSEAQLASAKAQLVEIENRKQALAESEAAFRQAEAQWQQAEVSLKQARANKANDEVRRYDVLTATASIARAQATMTNAQSTLDQTIVRAPSEGVVLKKYVEQGTIIASALSFAATGNNILQLGDVTRMYVDVNVDETDIANVDEGQDVEITIEAYPGIPFQGTVTRINPEAVVEQNVTTVHVRVEIDNSAVSFRLLKPGMNATCEFVNQRKDDVVAIPNEALRTDDQGQFVEVSDGKGKPAPPDPKTGTPADEGMLIDLKVERRKVEVGLEGNDSTEIVSGLKPGEKIVVQRIEPAPKTAGSPFAGGGPPGMRGMGRGR